MTLPAETIHRPTLIRDAARLQEALGELIRVLQFRDRDRACCYGLSVSQCYALEALIQNGPMTVTQLGDHLYLEKSTASRLAKALLEKELVRKRAPRADGRIVILQVTEAGHRLARKILNDLAEEYMDLLEQFEAEVRAALPVLLDRLTQSISSRTDPQGPTCCEEEKTMKEDNIRRAVRERYGSIAREGTVGCGCGCSPEDNPDADLVTLGQTVGYSKTEMAIVPDGTNMGLGCGNPTALAHLKEGETVLDLGSGAGFDCFLASKEVGPKGRVIGVDMTPDMVERARRAAQAGGYDNVEFRLGEIEALPVPDNAVDAVISNCVLNLSPARDRVFAEVMRILKPGGRIMISDLISVHPTPPFLLENTDALVGCLPVQEDEYLEELRASGLENVEIVEEKAYPNDLLTMDPAVQDFLKAHPDEEKIILDFIASIRSGMIQGTKPGG